MPKYNYKMKIVYDGTRYKGWQRLKATDNTIQGKIEDILSKNFDEEIKIVGSGRTDSGVHARGQIANFWTQKRINVSEIKRYLNRYLPEDISCVNVEEVEERFHSRYNAKKKRYRYTIQNDECINPFIRKYSWHIEEKLDLDIMKRASKLLEGKIDFSSFTNLKSKKKSKIRTIYKINILRNDSKIIIDFEGDGFLQHMVRILVGTLVELGKNNMTCEELELILRSKKRNERCPLAPAKGLCLEEVCYEDN
ncbi:MAG: tRNA pseudouridine(38-40) synthase TruA [Tissierellales bacterium]|nr:tRNA pseudouridine(38-40) synthase TruA [Tissierellales bacterium]